ncbi:hypothetical protein RB213_000964 [Colletotrichum asianum]
MSVYLSLNEELHDDLNEDAIFTPGDMWQSEDEDNEGEDGGARGTTRETQRWAIDHSTGHHRLQGDIVETAACFIQRVLAKDFKSTDVLKMMQEKHTIDFGSRRAGCTQARPSDGFFPQFYLDFFSVVSKPGRPISRHSRPIFNNITMSFQRWSAPYGAKHVSRIPFNVTRRTFRIAQASTRKTWFIVMHPAGEKSGMPMPLACELASYITGVFQSPALLGEGIQRLNWWMAFQEAFMEGWAAWSGRHSGATSFWARHEPAFHAYDYGANIEIEVSEELYDLPRERHCAMDDSEDEEDGEETGGGWVDDDDDDETLRLEELSVADDGPRRAEVEGRIFDECDGLQKLVLELETRFQLENITAVSYALAICINSDRTTKADRLETCYLLANRNMLAREFASTCDYTFYPQAFHLVYFQGYSNIKRSVRYSPHNLLATKGYATGALTMPTSDAGATSAAREKRERLLRIIRGPNKLKPFARERQQIDVAVEAKEVAFQLKQVMSLDVRRMTSAERTFKTVIRPIF